MQKERDKKDRKEGEEVGKETTKPCKILCISTLSIALYYGKTTH